MHKIYLNADSGLVHTVRGTSGNAIKDPGDAWASVIVQRMHGDIEVLAGIAEQVQQENAKGANGDVAVMRDETRPGQGKPLPVLHCGEVIDRPAVRAAIQKAIAALRPSYESR